MATYVADPWTALGDPSRRQVFELLTRGPKSVTEVADGLPISRPAVSQHLRVLKQARLVRARPQGTKRIYEIDHEGLAALRRDLDRFWGTTLQNFKQLVEAGHDIDDNSTEEQS